MSDKTINKLAGLTEFERAKAINAELLEVLKVLVDHAQEQYPHFESDRGTYDIRRALNAIDKAEGR